MIRTVVSLLAFTISSLVYADSISTAHSETTQRVVLDNGLTVIVREDHRMPILVSQIWYKVGSSYEHGGITGISHLFEHLMFKGTPRFPQGQFSKIIALNGGQQNAFTSHDFTVYFQNLSNDKLAISFELEADRMQHLMLSTELLENEKKIVLEERRLRTEDQPPMRAYERFRAAAFVSSSYRYPVVGWADDIQGYTLENLKNWYAQWYAPNNAVIVVVGDVNPNEVINLAKHYFGKIPSRSIPTVALQEEVSSLGERRIGVNIPAQMSQVYIGYDVPVVKTLAPNAWEPYALMLLSAVLDGSSGARLTKELVRAQQIAVSTGAEYDPFERKNSLFMVMATPKEASATATVEAAIYREINKLQTDLIPPEELERVKTLFIANHVYHKDSLNNQAIALGSLESVGLDYRLEEQLLDNIQKVTAEQIKEMANKYLIQNRRTVAVLNPLPLS